MGWMEVASTEEEKKFVFAERVAWYEGATRAIEGRIRASAATWSAPPAGGVARGVVLFVGDGMGMSTLTAARILSGQRRGNTGEEAQLAWDSFPAVALARVSPLSLFLTCLSSSPSLPCARPTRLEFESRSAQFRPSSKSSPPSCLFPSSRQRSRFPYHAR